MWCEYESRVQGCRVAASAMEPAASSSSPTPQNDNLATEGGDGSYRKSSVTKAQ